MLTALAACTPPESDDELANRSGIPPTRIRYFPPSSSQAKVICFRSILPSREPAVDGFANRWYSQHLAAAKEPSLYLAARTIAPTDLAAFRFTWLRSFDAPVFIRLSLNRTGKYHLVAKELSGAGGYAPGTRKRTLARDLLPSEARNFRQLMQKTDFLRQPPTDCALGFDGSEWVFEAIDQQGYHLFSRWSPDKGPARDVGEFLLMLSGWHFDRVY